MHISIHGLLRGTDPEVGADIDTGGQVRYVLDLIEAMGSHRSIRKVDLLTRKITDARVASDYGVEREPLYPKVSIRRIPCGPGRYMRKELLWPHLSEFTDGALAMIREQGELPDVLHAHYADAGLVAVRLSKALGVPVVFTGHSLGRFKLANLMARGMEREKANQTFNLPERIEAEEETIENSALIVASSKTEEHEQYRLYDHYERKRIMVNPPGCDLAKFGEKPGRAANQALQQTLARFLGDPAKPALIMLARPDPQKNILAAIETFAEAGLRDKCNLVLFLGARDDIRELEPAQKKLLQDVLYLIDRHNLYGSVAYPFDDCRRLARWLKRRGCLNGIGRVGRRGRQQVLRIDETPTRLPETLRGLLLAEPIHIDALFANAGGKPGKVAVGRNETESVEPPAVQKVHCVDHQRDVGGVLARCIGKLLLWDDGVFRQNIGPALRAGAGEITVDAPNAGFPNLRDFLEQPVGNLGRRVIGIDQNCKAWGSCFSRHEELPI
jgi:sucrose-phosphate synthase-like glycosyltransferase